jgi:2-polyprenyl-3-methyl-5-hydroxy-6-metoxy-1,4-benzoquinol methylase
MDNTQIKTYYNSRYKAEQLNAFPCDVARTSIFMRPVLERIAQGGKVLDIGCGVGYTCELFLKHKFEVSGVDISEEAAKLAQKRVPQGQFAQIDNDCVLPYPNDSFDAITCFGVLEHVLNPDLLLKECRRIIKKSGIAVFVVPNSLSVYFLFSSGTGQIYENPRTYAEWKDLLCSHQFHIIETHKNPGPTMVKSDSLRKKAKLLVHKFFNLFPLSYT